MKKSFRTFILALFMLVMIFPLNAVAKPQETKTGNPYLPLWEHIPDGEPHVFASPDSEGQRLYIYGSHDSGATTSYCGRDYVTWSASTNDLSDWKCEGEIFNASTFDGLKYTDDSGTVKSLYSNRGRMLYAPDVLYYPETETYYLFMSPNPDNKIFAASSKSPCGPFTSPQYICDGFDPAVLVDDTTDVNGHRKVYLYYSTESGRDCFACQLDPFNNMKPVKGTLHYPDTYSKNSDHSIAEKATMISKSLEPFYFFEGPSIRKVNDWYILSYQRSEPNGSQNGKLAEIGWAYCKNPFGDSKDSSNPDKWHYGGVIVSNLGQTIKDPYSQKNINTFYGQNNHGGMVEINGKWYQIYHRATGNGLKRQSMVEEIAFSFNDDGTPSIKQAEMTSQGFSSEGLYPFCDYYATIACYEIGGTASSGQWMSQSSLYPVFNCTADGNYSSSGRHGEWYPVQDLRHHCWLGYKYFNFESGISDDDLIEISLSIKEYAAGKINIYSSDAREYEDGKELSKILIGTISLSGTDTTEHIVNSVLSPETLTDKKAIYLEFISNQNSSSSKLCDLNKIGFSIISKMPESHEHSYQTMVIAPTCTERGYTTHSCSCGYSYKDNYTDMLDHSYGNLITKIDPTCTADGMEAHYKCSVCNKLFDAEKKEITASDITITKLGHDYVHHDAKDPTCTEVGWDAYDTCKNCNYTTYKEKTALGHKYGSLISTVPATCTTDGMSAHYKCSVCNKLFDNYKREKTEAQLTITKQGHAIVHHEAKAPTCISVGWDAYDTCSNCDYTTYVEKPIADHNYGNLIAQVDPTCTADGMKEHYKCSVCNKLFDAEKKETTASDLKITKLGHNYESISLVPATTSADGYTAHTKCTRCGDEQNKTKIYKINTITLSQTEFIYDGSAKKPTATIKDTRGKGLSSSSDYSISYSNNVNVGTSATATITFKGNYSGTVDVPFSIVSSSSEIFNVTINNGNAYTYVNDNTNPSVVVKDGNNNTLTNNVDYTTVFTYNLKTEQGTLKITFKGNYASNAAITRTFDILCPHKNVTSTSAVAATCTTAGNSAYWHCNDCDKYFSDSSCTTVIDEDSWIINKLGHEYAGITDTPAGSLSNGKGHYECKRCHALGNSYTIAGTAPSYVKSLKLKKAKKTITVKFKKQSKKTQKKFGGYQIRYSTTNNVNKAKKTTAKKYASSKKIKKLKAKTKYYVWVRTYTKTSKGTFYSKWSAKSVKTK